MINANANANIWLSINATQWITAVYSLPVVYIIGSLVLKVGYVFFQKRIRKLSRGPVPKQICSQSAVRGVSTRDPEEIALSAHDGH